MSDINKFCNNKDNMLKIKKLFKYRYYRFEGTDKDYCQQVYNPKTGKPISNTEFSKQTSGVKPVTVDMLRACESFYKKQVSNCKPITQVKEKGVLTALYIDPTQKIYGYGKQGVSSGVSYVGSKISPARQYFRQNVHYVIGGTASMPKLTLKFGKVENDAF